MQARIWVIGYYGSELKHITGRGKKETHPYVEMFGALCQFAFLSFHPSLIVCVREIRLMTMNKKV